MKNDPENIIIEAASPAEVYEIAWDVMAVALANCCVSFSRGIISSNLISSGVYFSIWPYLSKMGLSKLKVIIAFLSTIFDNLNCNFIRIFST